MKKFYQGWRVHAYFKDILRSIYTTKNKNSEQYIRPEYAIAHHSLENNIAQATNVDFIRPYTFGEGSTNLRDNVGTGSGQVRQSFGGSSTAVRQVVEGQSKRSRTAPEQESKPSRTRVEADSNNSRTSVEENLSNFEHLTPGAKNWDAVKDRFVPAPNQVLTLFYHRASLHRSCTVDIPSLHREKGGKPVVQGLCRNRETYNKVKSRLKQSPNEVSTKVNEKEPKLETSVFSLTTFAPTSTFLQVGFESALGRLRVNSMNTRMRLEANPSKCRRRIGESINLIFRLFTIAVQWLCLKTMLMLPMAYKIGAGHALENYRRGTADGRSAEHSDASISLLSDSNSQSVDQACVKQCICIDQVWIVRKTVPIHALSTLYLCFIYASSILDPYLRGALSKIKTFKAFNLASCVYVCFCVNNPLGRLKSLLNKIVGCVYDVMNEGGVVKSLKSIQIPPSLNHVLKSLLGASKVLTSIRANALLVLMVSMFSLSAQTPRKDSGANGLSNLVALQPGDQIPDAVWEMSFLLHDFKKGAKTIKLEELKGKVILFDFWSTTCKSCIEGIPKMEELQKKHGKDLAIILVNSKRNKDTPQRLKAVFDNYKATNNYEIGLPSLLDDTVFTTLFPHNTIPTHAWIDRAGKLVGMNKTADEIDNKVQSLINGEDVNFLEMGMIVNQDRSYNPPLVDTAGKLSTSIFAKARPNFLPTQKNVYYENGHTFFQLGNHVLTIILQYAFYDELKDYMLYQFVFDPQLSNGNQLSMYRDLKKKYWYELYHADSIDKQIVKEWVRADVKRYFQLEVIRKKELKDVYEVELTAAFTKIHLNSGMPSKVSDLTENEIQLNNMILFHFFNLLCPYLDRPVVIGDEKMNYFNLKLPKGFIHFSMDQKLKFLASQGILLKPVKKVIEYPYFKRTTNP